MSLLSFITAIRTSNKPFSQMLDKSKLYISWYQAVTTLALHFSALHLWIIGNCSALNLIIAKQLLISNLLKKKGAHYLSAFFFE